MVGKYKSKLIIIHSKWVSSGDGTTIDSFIYPDWKPGFPLLFSTSYSLIPFVSTNIPVAHCTLCWYHCTQEQLCLPLAHLNLPHIMQIWLEGIPCLKLCILALYYLFFSEWHIKIIKHWMNDYVNE